MSINALKRLKVLKIKNTFYLNLTWCEENRKNKEAKSDDDRGNSNADLQSQTDA